MGIAFHPTTGLQGVFRVRSDEAESFTVGRIDAAMGSKIVTDQRHVYPASDMLFCGSRDEAATLAIHLNDLAKSFHCFNQPNNSCINQILCINIRRKMDRNPVNDTFNIGEIFRYQLVS